MGAGCPEPCLLEGAERGCGGQRGTWWPQDGEGVHTLAGEEEREGEAQCERAWAFQGEKNHTTEGDSNGVRRGGAWATMPPPEPLDRGSGWWLLCHRQALGCLEEAQQGLHGFGQTKPPSGHNWHKPSPKLSSQS